jgi:hypothetical protein
VTNGTGQTPPGWYPAAEGSSQLRWWDGSQWTEHVSDPAAPTTAPAALRAPEGTDPNTIWAWLVALTPILSLIGVVVYYASIGTTLRNLVSISDTGRISSGAYGLGQVFTPAYFAVLGLSLVSYALNVIFAYLDWRELKARQIPSPFHWAWSFLEAPLVYMIGRSVVVRRRTSRGLGPLWLTIAIIVIGLIVSIIEVVTVFASVAGTLPSSVLN